MAETLDTKQKTGTSTQIKSDVEQLQKVGFGAAPALAAAEAAKVEVEKVDNREVPHRREHHHDEPDMVELREKEMNEVLLNTRVKSNAALTGEEEKRDPWTDPNKVDEEDDVATAMLKKAQRAAQDAALAGTESEPDQVLDLNLAEGINDVSVAIRQHAHFGLMQTDPELIIVMGGLSETFDAFAAARGISVQNPAQLTDSDLQFVLQMLQQSKKKVLSEEEKEAELILSGAVAILAIPEIMKKLEELGVDIEDVPSLNGQLAKLIAEAQDPESEYHGMYLLIREEAEFSKLPPEDETAQIAE